MLILETFKYMNMHRGSEIRQCAQKGKVPSRGNYYISQLHIWVKLVSQERKIFVCIYMYVCVYIFFPEKEQLIWVIISL